MTTHADTLRPLAEADLPLVRAWRNHPGVRQHMFSTHEIAEAEHQQWFARQQAMGFVHFSGVAPGGVAEWGFYAAPGAPRGTGRALGQAALARAFGTEQLHKVCGQVLAGNTASLALHRRLGFAEEGVLRQQHRSDGPAGAHYHDVFCFGLLRADWPGPAQETHP
jgi:UDP-4-amino-4,6-dideoxy-N-acetyl-beta-L-altrosamine N-acetyltransferase